MTHSSIWVQDSKKSPELRHRQTQTRRWRTTAMSILMGGIVEAMNKQFEDLRAWPWGWNRALLFFAGKRRVAVMLQLTDCIGFEISNLKFEIQSSACA